MSPTTSEKRSIYSVLISEGMEENIATQVTRVSSALFNSIPSSSERVLREVQRAGHRDFHATNLADALLVLEHHQYVIFDAMQGKYALTDKGREAYEG